MSHLNQEIIMHFTIFLLQKQKETDYDNYHCCNSVQLWDKPYIGRWPNKVLKQQAFPAFTQKISIFIFSLALFIVL